MIAALKTKGVPIVWVGLPTIRGAKSDKGAEKLGHYVEHDLRRVLSSHVVPVALPGPEEQSTAKDAAVGRPAIGPVVPLSAIGGGEGGDLSGAASHPVEREADALATRVLNRGDAIVAPTRYEFEETELR